MALPSVMKNKSKGVKSGMKVQAGPSGKMMQGQATGPQKPGVSSQEQSRSKGKSFGVKGGGGKMFGKSGVKKQTPA